MCIQGCALYQHVNYTQIKTHKHNSGQDQKMSAGDLNVIFIHMSMTQFRKTLLVQTYCTYRNLYLWNICLNLSLGASGSHLCASIYQYVFYSHTLVPVFGTFYLQRQWRAFNVFILFLLYTVTPVFVNYCDDWAQNRIK